MSSKEREILERQRRLAAQLSGGSIGNGVGETSNSSTSTTGTSSTSRSRRTASGSKPKPPPPRGPRLPPPPPPPRRPATPASSYSAFIRPGGRKVKRKASAIDLTESPPIDLTESPQEVVARSGSASAKSSASSSAKPSASAARSTNNASSSAFMRAPVRQKTSGTSSTGGGAGSSRVASLLKSAGASRASLQSKPVVHYPKFEQEDFWRTLRDWDFVTAFNEERMGRRGGGGSGQNNSSRSSNNNNDGNGNRKRSMAASDASSGVGSDGGGRSQSPAPPPPDALPDTFDSVRQYTALWAPLCLEEAKAQILSEASGDVPYWNKRGKGPFPVVVAPLKRDVGSSVDYITVQLKPTRTMSQAELESVSPSFRPNDIVVLVRDEDTIIRASKGNLNGSTSGGSDNTNDRRGIVGHTESSRRTVDGLWVKVSRKHWLAAGRQNMCLLNVGSNVTALREFHALCRLSTIPLSKYVMGKDLAGKANDSSSALLTKSKANMMQKMGGSSALGKGFVSFAKQKFNPSQLQAISASATEYGEGGFTLIKGPPGTGKTTTLVTLLNSLHIRQFNKYYQIISDIAKSQTVNKAQKIGDASRNKPRLLVCAPSNAAVDNVILKIMEDGFIDGSGSRYNPSIIRVGVGQSDAVRGVGLEAKVDSFLSEARDAAKIEAAINGYRTELQRIQGDIVKLRKRIHALSNSSPYPLSQDWEARIDETNFDATGMIYFVNHKDKITSYEVPPPPEPGEKQFPISSMPEYRTYVGRIVKLVERHDSITSKLEKYRLAQSLVDGGRGSQASQLRMTLETLFLDETHVVFTTLGTAGNRALESSAKFEVVVIDEAAQSVEPSTLVGLQLGSKHAILVGDPQQLPATIFSYSGRTTKYDRSLFQRLEEAGHEVHLLNKQYRMHPDISEFPRHIFYGGALTDGPNVEDPDYGMPMKRLVQTNIPAFRPLTVLDLDSSEERGGTSLSNSAEARLAVHLYDTLRRETGGTSARSRVAVITPYAQQASLLRRMFSQHLGPEFQRLVEVNTVDAFQGREANIVIFSCVRAAGSQGIGFLSDVRRMNVAITRAKFFLFVIARCKSIVVNPYWREFVNQARSNRAVVPVPMFGAQQAFPDLKTLQAAAPPPRPIVPLAKKQRAEAKGRPKDDDEEDGELPSGSI